MILTPLASYGLALCFTSDPVLLGTIIIVMGTPCAINALITERLYDLNVNLAMAPFITTQILYILILYPAFYLLVSWGYLPLNNACEVYYDSYPNPFSLIVPLPGHPDL